MTLDLQQNQERPQVIEGISSTVYHNYLFPFYIEMLYSLVQQPFESQQMIRLYIVMSIRRLAKC